MIFCDIFQDFPCYFMFDKIIGDLQRKRVREICFTLELKPLTCLTAVSATSPVLKRPSSNFSIKCFTSSVDQRAILAVLAFNQSDTPRAERCFAMVPQNAFRLLLLSRVNELQSSHWSAGRRSGRWPAAPGRPARCVGFCRRRRRVARPRVACSRCALLAAAARPASSSKAILGSAQPAAICHAWRLSLLLDRPYEA